MVWEIGPFVPIAISVLAILAFVSQQQLLHLSPPARTQYFSKGLLNKTDFAYSVSARHPRASVVISF